MCVLNFVTVALSFPIYFFSSPKIPEKTRKEKTRNQLGPVVNNIFFLVREGKNLGVGAAPGRN